MPSLAQRMAFATSVTAFGLCAVTGLVSGVVEGGGLPSPSGRGSPELSLAELYTQARIQPRNPVMLSSVAAALAERGEVEGAIELYQTALRVHPASAHVHGKLAGLYLRAGRIEEGRREARLSVRNGIPVDPEILRGLGFRRGDR